MSSVSRREPVICVTVLVGSLLFAGCASTVAGVAVRAQGAGPVSLDVPELVQSDLDRVLLSVGEVNGIMEATGIRVTASSEDMSDNSDGVSDLDCLGAIYGAEELVYQGSGWTAVRDQVLQEPINDNQHWVEQIAVLYPVADKAQAFVEASRTTWDKCGNTTIDIDNSDVHSTWKIDAADVSDQILTQTSTQRHAGGWGCQHALTAVSNLVAEAWACSGSIGDEAKSIVAGMVNNAAKK
ncbi:sensor domain-containing protein [Mycolicibacterium sp. CBM1]